MRNATTVAKEAHYSKLSNGDLSVEGAAIIYKNFDGGPTKFNPAGGKRTFSLVVPQDIADQLVADGWNVKVRHSEDGPEDDMFYTEIVVNLESQYPPKLHLITRFAERESMIELDASNIKELDNNFLYNVDLIIHPFNHGRVNAAGATVKGYLKTLYATVEPSMDFGGKYNHLYGVIPDADEMRL